MDLWRARLLEDGAVLILFPEGTRSRTGAMARLRPGIGSLVAVQGGADGQVQAARPRQAPVGRPGVPCSNSALWRKRDMDGR